jgi:tetratricopeptide (TPR) repeat protein
VHYSCGPWSTYRYVYPYYHRKYLFISLGGYWPISYRYVRYYWYGSHPYNWYGYYPIPREVRSDTYNYYTYNYYNNENATAYEPGQVADADIFENLAQQEPDQATLADVYFEEAVKVFEVGSYGKAVEKFARAMELAPDDMILPFAYSQALLANGQYSEAAEVLRGALAKVRPEKEGVFYPRGLYPNEDILLGQIDRLAEKAELFAFDADLQLLLGYQLLGIGEVDQAVEPLMHASKDLVNADAAAVLLELLEKIKTTNGKADDAGTSQLPAEGNRIIAESNRIPVEESSRIPAESGAIIKAHSIRFKEGMFLATLCALGTSAGIARYIRC